MPPDAVTVHLGYGRTRAGRVAEGAGFNAYTLRTSDAPWAGFGRTAAQDRRLVPPGGHAGPPLDGRPRHRPRRHPRGLQGRARFPAAPRRGAAEVAHAVSGLEVRGLQVGHGGRPDRLHRLLRVRGRVRGGEQHSRHRQGAGAARPRDALAAHRSLLRGGARQPGDLPPADALPALRERAVRGGLPRGGDDAQPGGSERDDLQPVRRHAVLLEQLPVQGAPVQLPALLGLGDAERQAGEEPRRDGAQPRRHGEVHLLRAAHQPRAAGLEGAGPGDSRRRDRDRLPGGVPDRRHRVRRFERPEEPCQRRSRRRRTTTACWRSSTRGRGRRISRR